MQFIHSVEATNIDKKGNIWRLCSFLSRFCKNPKKWGLGHLADTCLTEVIKKEVGSVQSASNLVLFDLVKFLEIKHYTSCRGIHFEEQHESFSTLPQYP